MMNKMIIAALVATTGVLAYADEPAAPQLKECIAPSDPGGGWDFTCRSVSKLLREEGYVDNNIQTVNMAGAGGGVAFAHVVSKRADDDGLFVAGSTATTTRLAQGQFRGMSADDVKWAGSLGADYGIIAVSKSSPYDTLEELFKAIQDKPGSVKFAGASTNGGWDHLKVLLAAKAAGIDDYKKIPYLSFNNGGDALIQVVGGHVNAFTGDISEVKGFMDSGDIKVLAVFADERLPEPFDGIVTAKEQGIDYIAPNWRGFYLPGKIDQNTYDWWVATLNELSNTDAWHDVMHKNGLMPFTKTGAEFQEYVTQQISDIQSISKDLGIIK